jgi:hypothetical protein
MHAMATWKLITCAGKNYTTEEASSGGYVIVRRNDGWMWSTGTKIGEATNMDDALAILRSDSGPGEINIRPG